MPAELAGSFNWITLWPDDGKNTPVVQAIYIDNSVGNYKGFGNLRTTDQTIYTLDSASRRFYVSVLWRDGEEGTVSLVQKGQTVAQLENNGWTTFQPGMCFVAGEKIYLQAENSNSKTSTALKLNIRIPVKDQDVDFGGTVSGSSGTGCAAMELESLDVKINGDNLPITMKVEDGKVIGIIGIRVQNGKTEVAFNKAKELIDKADNGMGDNIFEQFANLFGGMTGKKNLWPKQQADMVIETEVKFLGYFEGQVTADEGGKLDFEIGMSKLAMRLEGESCYTSQHIILGFPVYWKAKLAAMLETAFQLYQETGLEEATLPGLHIETELSLEGEAAAGIVDVVGAGVKGKGAFEAASRLPIDPDDMTLKLTGNLSLFVTLVGMTGEMSLLDGEYIFYEDGIWYPNDQVRTFTIADLGTEMELQKISRDYLENDTAFVANEKPRHRAILPENGTVTTKQIMANNYPYADPQLVTLPDGGQVLVWLEDDGTGHMGTALYYSYSDGNTWTEPAAVALDGTSDFEPELKLVDDTLWLLWLDAEETIPADCTDVAAISALLDVSAAIFDSETLTFGAKNTFGRSGIMDLLPDVTKAKDQPVVVWISTEDSLLSLTECDLWMAQPTEKGWQKNALYMGLTDVDSLCADLLQGLLTISFSQSAGEAAPENKELYTLSCLYENGQFAPDGDPIRKTDNTLSDTDPAILCGLLWWVQEGRLLNTAGQSVDISGSGGNYRIIDDGSGNTAILYAVTRSDEAVDFYAILDSGSGWSAPTLAASSSGPVTGWSAQYDGKGKLTIAASELEGDMADLSVYTITPKKDLAVTSVYVDGYSLIPGKALRVFAEVENTGLTEVSSYTLTGKLDGSSAGSHKGGTLRPGEHETLCFTCTVPENGASELTVSLGSDTNTANNTQILSLAQQDLSVEGVHLSLAPNGSGEATVSVINRGLADSGTATLTLKRLVPGSDTWELLSEPVTVEGLMPQVMTAYTLPLTGSAQEGDLVYAVLEITDADHVTENNSDFAVATLPKTGTLDFDHSSILSVSDGKALIQAAAENETDQTVHGLLCIAAYDGAKMTDVEMLPLSLSSGECLLECRELTCPAAGEIRIFILDCETYAPLREMILLES